MEEPRDAAARGTAAPARRALLRTAAWTAPIVAASVAVPAYALSQQDERFGILFDGGSNSNGFLGNSYLDFGVATGSTAPYTLTSPIVITFSVVGLLTTATAERDYTAGSSYGTLSRGAYNSTTRTTVFTWTLPAGTSIPRVGTGTNVPDVLFSWRDGLQGLSRVTNKVVVTSITGGVITQVNSSTSATSQLPADSSVAKDNNQSAVSPDGIY